MKTNPDIFKIKHNDTEPEQGLVLVSEPFAPDSIFSRSVVLLAEHNEEGTVGFILNKPVNRKLSQLSSDFGNFDMKVSLGGAGFQQQYILFTYIRRKNSRQSSYQR
jgi:putative AlgH/UPF0301 family transcriptional regulator